MNSISRTLLILGVLIVAGFLLRATVSAVSVAQASDPAYWHAEIARRGGTDAYRAFAQAVEAFSLSDQHRSAHAFGNALYRTEGAEGIAACDTNFAYGCWHELIGEAIVHEGPHAASRFLNACAGDLSCEHGIGHGLVSYEGYELAALRRALESCRNLQSANPSSGCRGGIFMEYHMRTMLQSGAKPLQPHAPLGDCGEVEDEDAPDCYFHLPTWWKNAGGMAGLSAPEAMDRFREWCALAPTPLLERSCAGGMGPVAADLALRTPEIAKGLCERARSDALALVCKTYAANVLGTTQSPEEGEMVCAGYYGSAAEYCLRQGGARFRIVVPPPEPPAA